MNRDDTKMIPYFLMEANADRLSSANKRLWVLCIILTVLLVVSNLEWLHYESQFEDSVATIDATQDGSGINIVGNGDVNYGAEGEDNN